jgi:regulator of sigma E protease
LGELVSFLANAWSNTWAFVLVLGVIVFFHESGHFIVAKAFKMRVFIFSFGFGRRLLGFKWGDTDYRLSLVPLGGYVKLEGEPEDRLSEDTSARGDGRDFSNRPRWQRFLVYLAGPVMNGVLTVAAFTVLLMMGFGIGDGTIYEKPVIGAVDPGSPADETGLKPGDEILSIDGKALPTWEDVLYAIVFRPDATLKMRIRHGSEEKDVTIHSRATEKKAGDIGVVPLVRVGEVIPGGPASAAGLKADDGILQVGGKSVRSFADIPPLLSPSEGKPLPLEIYRGGEVVRIDVTPKNGRIGIASKTVFRQLRFAQAVPEAFRETWRMTKQTAGMLTQLITGQISPKAALTGPVGIAQVSGDAARSGSRQVLYVVAALSLSVGLLNLFPLAPLDGGHLAILVGEGLLGRDFSLDVKAWIMNAGAMVLFLLIGLVLYSDLTKISWLGKHLP